MRCSKLETAGAWAVVGLALASVSGWRNTEPVMEESQDISVTICIQAACRVLPRVLCRLTCLLRGGEGAMDDVAPFGSVKTIRGVLELLAERFACVATVCCLRACPASFRIRSTSCIGDSPGLGCSLWMPKRSILRLMMEEATLYAAPQREPLNQAATELAAT